MMPEIQPDLTQSQKILLNLTSMNTALNDMQHDVTKLKEVVLEGNGELPLREVVRNHDSFIKEIRYWMKFIVGIGITGLVGNAVAIAIYVIKQMP